MSEAIESVLAQTYPKTEVIVVDDGSTDNSRQIIAKYDDQIVAVLKDNGGQASAFNAGFLRSRGGIVVFLDADDILLPDTAGQIAETFQCDPHIARIQYRLAVIDRSGAPTGAVALPAYIGMLGGDLRRHIFELNNCAAWWPTTSGDALLAEKVVHPETRPSLHKLFSVRYNYNVVRQGLQRSFYEQFDTIARLRRAIRPSGYLTTRGHESYRRGNCKLQHLAGTSSLP